MEPRRIFGTKYFANFNGTVTDIFGNVQATRKKPGGNVQVKLGNKWLSLPRVIAETFIKVSKKPIVHLDGDKLNNAAYNLIYSNPTGISFEGYHNAYKHLKRDIMISILKMVDDEEDLDDICKKFRIHYRTIMLVIKRRKENNI